MHPLHAHIANRIDFDDTAFQQCLNYFHEVNFQRNALVVKPGEYVRHQYFVVQGCLRTYYLDDKDKDYTMQFAVENWWASDYIAYYSETKSSLYVECIEAVQLLAISKSNLNLLFQELPALEHFFRRQLESAFVAFQKRILANLHKPAEERYEDFLNSYPTIEQRVKNYQIASYLGITPESLSRIRKLRTSNR